MCVGLNFLSPEPGVEHKDGQVDFISVNRSSAIGRAYSGEDPRIRWYYITRWKVRSLEKVMT